MQTLTSLYPFGEPLEPRDTSTVSFTTLINKLNITNTVRETLESFAFTLATIPPSDTSPYLVVDATGKEWTMVIITNATPLKLVRHFSHWINGHVDTLREIPFLIVEDTSRPRLCGHVDVLWGHHVTRNIFKGRDRDMLLDSLQGAMDMVSDMDLPATIDSVYIVGSVARGVDMVSDIDILVYYSQTDEEKSRDARIREALKDHDTMTRLLGAVRCAGWTRAMESSPAVHDVLATLGYPVTWFMYTNQLSHEMGAFTFTGPVPRIIIEKIVKSLVHGSSVRACETGMMDGAYDAHLYANPVLAWSRDKPDVAANLNSRSPEVVRAHLVAEMEDMTASIESKRRNGWTFGPLAPPDPGPITPDDDIDTARAKVQALRDRLSRMSAF